ncbi:drug resistance transporter, EmrB/QacA subfamily [Micromonospora phaseoli]|uniref:Drug resistance transporter, EmrB/QacA subfamily n=1 Tax=Micromonospora phaseoli TaxID=1144548 RepID=A0A1H7DP09_9ACTN|nr:MFS transporter [Micromonospora phaseoli]PZV90512.1 EmrB/QacA subfamily drug resistance transporter [Micromonospora phaseoli]GIJ78096.1 MFS transporter [Micromonospora phaseoli]SEJ99985.1 drug resistance transporter, EmrB/QacA subfamily [Micromonospora phaseoli]
MPEPAHALRLRSSAGRGTLVAAVLASGMVFLDSTVVNVALPRLGAELDASVAGLQWTVNGYLLTLAAFVLLGGALGDRFGRRRIFLLGVVWFTIASVLCGLALRTDWLVAARFLQGAGGALLTPGSLSLLQASFHPDDRAKTIGAWSGLSGVSTALGPFIGGWLIDALSWRWIFFLNVPLAVLVVLATLRWVPESRDESVSRTRGARRFDVAGALLGALGLAGVTYALVDAPGRGLHSPAVLAAALVAVLAAVAFVFVERRRGEAAMLPTGLFGSRLFSVLNVFTVLVYAALGGFTFFIAVYLQNVLDWSALLTGLALLPMTLLLLIGSPGAGALSTRIGPRLPLTVGPVLAAGGLLMLREVSPGASYWGQVLPGVALFGAGLTLVVAPLTASVLAAVEDRFAGVASGFNNAASRVGGLLAVAALPLLVGLSGAGYEQPAELTAAYRGALLWCAGLLLAGAAIAVLLVRRPARRPPPAQPCHSMPVSTPK